MADYCDDESRPTLPEGDERPDRNRFYIEHTSGLWMRKNRREDTLEIWMDGKFQVSWNSADVIEDRLQTMMREAVEIGKRVQREETARAFKRLLGL